MQRCPEGHEGSATLVETLADRFHCLVCGTYFYQDGKKAPGGAVWTTPVPETHRRDAEITVDATRADFKPTAKPKKKARK